MALAKALNRSDLSRCNGAGFLTGLVSVRELLFGGMELLESEASFSSFFDDWEDASESAVGFDGFTSLTGFAGTAGAYTLIPALRCSHGNM